MSFLFSDPNRPLQPGGEERLAADEGMTPEAIAKQQGWSPEEFNQRLRKAIQIEFPNAREDGAPGLRDLATRHGLGPDEADAAERIAGMWHAPIDTSELDGKTEAEMEDMLRRAGIVNAREIAGLGKQPVAGILEMTRNDKRPGVIERAARWISGLLPRKPPEPQKWPGPGGIRDSAW